MRDSIPFIPCITYTFAVDSGLFTRVREEETNDPRKSRIHATLSLANLSSEKDQMSGFRMPLSLYLRIPSLLRRKRRIRSAEESDDMTEQEREALA